MKIEITSYNLKAAEEKIIRACWDEHTDIEKCAKQLKVSSRTLYRRLKEYDIAFTVSGGPGRLPSIEKATQALRRQGFKVEKPASNP